MTNPAAPFVYDTTTRRFYHGTRADLKPGVLLQPGNSSNYTERRSPWIYFSETLHAYFLSVTLGSSINEPVGSTW